MNVDQVNQALLAGAIDAPGVLPRYEALRAAAVRFAVDFGLSELPRAPGVLIIRGARQFGKSTWLEGAIHATVSSFGPGSALFLDGDGLQDADHLAFELSRCAQAFAADAPVRRLFIDEITAVAGWERSLKRTLDRGELQRVLVITTGSHVGDLRHGAERLPGRKGRLARTNYLFTPLSYAAFAAEAEPVLGEATLSAYLLSGGAPPACTELVRSGRLGAWTIETARDWIAGEVARAGRSRHALMAVMRQLHAHGGTALGQSKLAREAGLANNTVAANWVDLLQDVLCLGISPAWDATRHQEIGRRPAKFPFVNLLVAAAWAPEAPRAPADWRAMTPARQGVWLEWAVAQELYRRAAQAGQDAPERLPYWQANDHEIDFVPATGDLVEVKRGRASALEFTWAAQVFKKRRLQVVCTTPFESDRVYGVTLDTFLRGG